MGAKSIPRLARAARGGKTGHKTRPADAEAKDWLLAAAGGESAPCRLLILFRLESEILCSGAADAECSACDPSNGIVAEDGASYCRSKVIKADRGELCMRCPVSVRVSACAR